MNDTKTVFDNFRRFTVSVKKERTSAAVDEMLIVTQGYSTELVPVDISNLANSIYRNLEEIGDYWEGVVYYTAKYAAWVHDMPGTLRGQPREHFGKTGNQSEFGPRQVVEFGGGSLTGKYWDGYSGSGKAEPKFLALAAEKMLLKDFDQIIRKYY